MKGLIFVIVVISLLLGAAVSLFQQPNIARASQGAQFFDNPFIGTLQVDPEDDTCISIVSPPTDDINDFLRVNPDGTTFLHIADHPATLSLLVGGVSYAGVGKLNANVQFGGSQFTFSSTAKVFDAAGNKGQAVCVFAQEGTNMVKVN
jgi:hypothetical protein